MSELKQDKPAAQYECKFVTYVPPPEPGKPDLHLIKLTKHENGVKTPIVKLVYDYERPYWTVRKGFQNYSQHKEWIEIDKVIAHKSPQHKLVQNASRALGMPWFKGNLKRLSESPYLFGTDILSTAVIKKAYMDKYPDAQSAFRIAIADTETDVLKGTEDIVMMSLTCKDRALIAVTKEYAGTYPEFIDNVRQRIDKYLSDIVQKRNIKIDILLVDSPVEAIKACINLAHEIKPDLLAFWNIDFDISKIIRACEKEGVDIRDIFCDPIVPKEYRYFEYIRGPEQKVTESGKMTPVKPAARWHTVKCPTSFYLVDAMCIYKHVRIGKAEEQSYSLDNILNKVLGIRKLKFTQADHLTGLKWHQFMQENFKAEYVVYNLFDCISIEILDEKTTDMSLTFPLFSEHSDFENFKSQPRRAVDKLHYFALQHGRVISATAPKPKKKNNESDDEEDDDSTIEEKLETLSLQGWIITLPAHLVADNGLCCIKENPNLRTNIRVHVGDLDVSASYPNGEVVFNISKETTKKEMGRIPGIDEYTQRMQGINLISGGHVNAVEYCTNMLNFPYLDELLNQFERTIN